MAELLCNVRGCEAPLAPEADGRDFVCALGHRFNVARSGYVNLLQPQDRRSKSPGDSKAVVAARGRLLDAGHGRVLLDALRAAIAAVIGAAPRSLVDIGCGDGYFASHVQEAFACDAVGVDISVPAIDAAARRHRACLWLVANADRRLPFAAGSVHVALAVTGRTHPTELARILAPDGCFVVAVPAPDDQVELRQLLYGQADAQDRLTKLEQSLTVHFDPVHRARVHHRARLDRAALSDLLCATYRGARQRERERLSDTQALDVTFGYELALFRPRAVAYPHAPRPPGALP